MRRRALALFAGILVLGLMPGPALADSTLDQVNESHDTPFAGDRTFAQTVTVGQTGLLTRVDLYMSAISETQITASITSLYRGTGYPIGPALASATVQVQGQGWYHFEFPTPVSFLAGGHFAIVFSVSQSTAKASAGHYPGGQALEYGTVWANLNGDPALDFAFRTYVEAAPNPTAQPVPTPTPAPTPAPKLTPAPTPKPIPTATATPLATASPTTTDPIATPTTTDTASPAASASASPSAQPDSSSGSSGDSGGPPIVLIIVGVVALAAVLGGGIGLGFVLARRRGQIS
jgi:hypothetical protein